MNTAGWQRTAETKRAELVDLDSILAAHFYKDNALALPDSHPLLLHACWSSLHRKRH